MPCSPKGRVAILNILGVVWHGSCVMRAPGCEFMSASSLAGVGVGKQEEGSYLANVAEKAGLRGVWWVWLQL